MLSSLDPEASPRPLRHSTLENSSANHELLSEPDIYFEIVIGYVGSRRPNKSSSCLRSRHRPGFVPAHPSSRGMLTFWADRGDLQPVRIHHRHLGDGFEKLQMITMMVGDDVTFLGGSLYSSQMMPSGHGATSSCSIPVAT